MGWFRVGLTAAKGQADSLRTMQHGHAHAFGAHLMMDSDVLDAQKRPTALLDELL